MPSYGSPGDPSGNPLDDPLDNPLENDPFENNDLKRLQLFVYLIPVVGFFPALWTLYRRQGSREQRNASRLSVTLATGWLLGYVLLQAGAEAFDASTLSLLILASLLTSGYFLVNLWLMLRLWQRKALRLRGISRFSDRLP